MPAERRPRTPRSGASPSRRRTGSRPAPVVAVTSASSPAGRAVVAALQAVSGPRPAPIRRVIAVMDSTRSPQGQPQGPDDLPGAELPAGAGGAAVQWCSADLSSPLVAAALAGAEVVVHVAAQDEVSPVRDPAQRRVHAVRSAQAVSTAAAAVGARRLVAVTLSLIHI